MAGTTLRVRFNAEVRQAPSLSSPLLHVAQEGKLVKQLSTAVDLPGIGSRVPLVPRGWIDADAVEPADAATEIRHPSAGAVASTQADSSSQSTRRRDAETEAAPARDLLRLLGDDRQLAEAPARQAEVADVPRLLGDDRQLQHKAKAEDPLTWLGDDRQLQRKADVDSRHLQQHKAGTEDPLALLGDDRQLQRKVEAPAWKPQQGWDWWEDSRWTGNDDWWQSKEEGQDTQQEKEEPSQWGMEPTGNTMTEAEVSPACAAVAWEAGRAASDVLFSGTVARLDFGGIAALECHEACALHGGGLLSVPKDSLPEGVGLGTPLCFALLGGGQVVGLREEVEPGARLVGTVKGFSRRQGSGERVGWITSAYTQRAYGCDVYVHGSMLEGLSIGDAVAFIVHVNARNQPQAATGSVERLSGQGDAAAGGSCNDGMDATVYAPGRVVFAPGEPSDCLLESLLDKAWRSHGQRGDASAA